MVSSRPEIAAANRCVHHCNPVKNNKKAGRQNISVDISATRLSTGDPVGFPPHLHRWFSIIVIPSTSIFCVRNGLKLDNAISLI